MHCCWTTAKPASDAHCACAIPANPARAQIQQTIALRHFAIWLLLFFLLVFFLLAEVFEEVFDNHVALFVGGLGSLPLHVVHQILPLVLGITQLSDRVQRVALTTNLNKSRLSRTFGKLVIVRPGGRNQ